MQLKRYIRPRKISVSEKKIYITDFFTLGSYVIDKSSMDIDVILFDITLKNKFCNFNNVLEIEDKLICTPFYSNSILEYDLVKKEITQIILGDSNDKFGKCSIGILYKNSSLMIPSGINSLIKYDPKLKRIKMLGIGSKPLEYYSAEICDDKLYIAKFQQPIVTVIDLIKNELSEIKIPFITNGFFSISIDKDKGIWLTHNTESKLYYYRDNKIVKYDLLMNTRYICKSIGDNVYLFACFAENILMLNKKNNQIIDITEMFEEEPIEIHSIYFGDVAVDVDETTIWAINTYRGVLYRLDTQSMKVDRITLYVPKFMEKDYENMYSEIFSEFPHGNHINDFILNELNGIHDLNGYIGALTSDVKFSVSSWIKDHKAEFLNGERIYNYCKII